ncbi:MAG: DUF998 domain-containing protein [Kiritimatiellales bacterium]|nr:DUF998 domain-containing protein [Kiritimatiellales bacterium]MCF7863461.1 DUF998 domain-containing protein [Kiritimatiellales bacterium]
MTIDINKLTYLSGFLGSVILVICCTVPAIPHPTGQEEAFSFLNHFMSELGYFKSSKLSVVYNSGLFIGAFTLTLFMAGLGLRFRSRLGYAAAVIGMFSCVSCGLLGFYPINRLVPHLALAYAFFISWPITVGLFLAQFRRDPTDKLSKGTSIPSIVSIVLFAVFLAMPFMIGTQRIMAIDLRKFVRPPFMFTALLEWLMCLSVFIWVMLVSRKLASDPATP